MCIDTAYTIMSDQPTNKLGVLGQPNADPPHQKETRQSGKENFLCLPASLVWGRALWAILGRHPMPTSCLKMAPS